MDNWATAGLPPLLAAMHGDMDGTILLSVISATWYVSFVLSPAFGAGLKQRLSKHTISYLSLVAMVVLFLLRALLRIQLGANTAGDWVQAAVPPAIAYGCMALFAPSLLRLSIEWKALHMDAREVTLLMHGLVYGVALWLRHVVAALLRVMNECTTAVSPLGCAMRQLLLPSYSGSSEQLAEVLRTLVAGMCVIIVLACMHMRGLTQHAARTAEPPVSVESGRGRGAPPVADAARVTGMTAASRDAAITWYTHAAVVIVGVEYPWLWLRTGCEPFTWVARFVLATSTRTALFLYWAVALTLLISVASTWLRHDAIHSHQRLLLTRKVFHVAAVIMFAPAVVVDGIPMLALSLAVALKVLVLLECMRALRGPPAAFVSTLHDFMRTFTDDRDAGVFILTHLYLLAGCAMPVWLALPRHVGTYAQADALELTLVAAGILSLGLGDTAAAAVGIACASMGVQITWGRVASWWAPATKAAQRKAPPLNAAAPSWARKTVQGSLAFVVVVIAGVALLVTTRRIVVSPLRVGVNPATWAAVFAIGGVASWAETSSALIDNVIVPLWAVAATTVAMLARAAWAGR